MKRSVSSTLGALLLCLATPDVSSAQTNGYDFYWTGTNGYSMNGAFSFATPSTADGRIIASELLSFSFTTYLNSTAVGSFNLDSPYAGTQSFNFQFDSASEMFFVGGSSGSASGNNWNSDGVTGVSCGTPGIGFNAGSAAQDLCVDGVKVSEAASNYKIQVRASTVPEPSSFGLLAAGMMALAAVGRRRRTV